MDWKFSLSEDVISTFDENGNNITKKKEDNDEISNPPFKNHVIYYCLLLRINYADKW